MSINPLLEPYLSNIVGIYIRALRGKLMATPAVLVLALAPDASEFKVIIWPWGKPVPEKFAAYDPSHIPGMLERYEAAFASKPPQQPVIILSESTVKGASGTVARAVYKIFEFNPEC